MNALGWVLLTAVAAAPSAPVPNSPAPGAYRNDSNPVQVDAFDQDAGVTRVVYEFRPADGGWSCPACPFVTVTRPPLNSAGTLLLPDAGRLLVDGTWCFRARATNADGDSPGSIESCFREDQTPPPAPDVRAVLSDGGWFFIRYIALPDQGPEASGFDRVCAGVTNLLPDGGRDVLVPYCSNRTPWRNDSPDASVTVFIGPGTWTPFFSVYDRNENRRLITRPEQIDITPTLPAPPAPFFLLPDGGRAPDGSWQRTRFFYPECPGIPGIRGSVVQATDGAGQWELVLALNGATTSNTIYRGPSLVRRFRYASVDATGAVTAWSSAATRRFDETPPAPVSCVLSRDGNAVDIFLDGGVDALNPTVLTVGLDTDGGFTPLLTGSPGDAGRVVLPVGTWVLSAFSTDTVGNQSLTTECSPRIVITELDAGLPDAGDDAGVADGGDDAGVRDGGDDAGVADGGDDVGVADGGDDAGSPDAGIPDAGIEGPGSNDAGSMEPVLYRVGWSCASVPPWLTTWLLLLFVRRRSRR